MSECIATIGLGFGDEGKGSIVDFLCRVTSASAVVRYNGGPQAAHHVVEEQGGWHCFSQFGSGTFVPGVRTHLSAQMLIKPSNLLVESDVLKEKGRKDALKRLTIDPRAYVVTPWHGMLCRLKEAARGAKRFGRVGMGVGEAARERNGNPEALQMGDLLSRSRLRRKLERHYEEKIKEARQLVEDNGGGELEVLFADHARENNPEKILSFYEDFGKRYERRFSSDEIFFHASNTSKAPIILEGAQGVLLDVRYGFTPYVTKTDVTLKTVDSLLNSVEKSDAKITKIGILRAYSTRHGAGPFVAHDSVLSSTLMESHNGINSWQGEFRIGHFDLLMARYALAISGGVDSIALTCLDRLNGQENVKICTAYEYAGSSKQLDDFFDWERRGAKVQVNAIKPQKTAEKQAVLSRLLFECRPLGCLLFDGWDNVSASNGVEGLPSSLRAFLSFLESEQGLSRPISMISLGATAKGKLLMKSNALS